MARLLGLLLILCCAGCYAPFSSPGIPANSLNESFRFARKANEIELNFSTLTREVPSHYLLGAGDIVRVEISEIAPFEGLRLDEAERQPINATTQFSQLDSKISEDGTILLPLVGRQKIGGLSVDGARKAIVASFMDNFLDDPKVSVSLIQKSEVDVMVLGGVANPGQYKLPKFENDIAHAIAAAGGMLDDQTEIQVHRKGWINTPNALPNESLAPIQNVAYNADMNIQNSNYPSILRVPLRSNHPVQLSKKDVELNDGDVVMIKRAPAETFFVVGQLNQNNQVRFAVAGANRDLGNGFLLPRDRDVDVVTAVAMAGYIDPIDSPTTVTVQRRCPDGSPLLIRVDLIAARFNRSENIMVQPGDIIYLNPDPAWWIRRTFDRIVPSLFTTPYTELMQRVIDPRGFN